MKSSIFVVALLATLQLTLAQRPIEGFNLLGPVPSLERTASNSPKYYYVSTVAKVWADAFSTCVNEGGQLATPFTNVQDTALMQYMVTGVPGVELVWVGAKATGSTYRWMTDDIAVSYSQLSTSAICTCSNGCLQAGHDSALNWYWCGLSCTSSRRFVCELE